MKNSFGDFLREKRIEKNLTQKKLSEILFVSESTISKWEKNVSRPDITFLPKLADLLGVTEHELITASIDTQTRNEKQLAKKWINLSKFWNLFFIISYIVALIPCFICNLAINKTLSWFWIVFSALILAYSITNLPKQIKKHKLILIPPSIYLALCILLATCAIYTNGKWFWVASISVLLCLIIVFTPIYISKYNVFKKIKKFNDFISIVIDFLLLNILLIAINLYTLNYSTNFWYLSIALPITSVVYLLINILMCVRFLKINKLLKTSIVLFLVDLFLYLPPIFIKVNNIEIQKEINQINILKANLSSWSTNISLENNIHLLIFVTFLITSIFFLIFGLIKKKK